MTTAGAGRHHPSAVVVMGASAGGVEALRALVGSLPANLPAAVLVVLHTGPGPESALAGILGRAGPLPAAAASDGSLLRAGEVVVARPDLHLLIRDGLVRLRRGPRENGHRPAVDPLFRSAARWYGDRVIAVVLSGTLDDGAAGAAAVAGEGGRVLVQDPAEALYGGMPAAALKAVPDAISAKLADLSAIIGEQVAAISSRAEGGSGEMGDSELLAKETEIAGLESDALLDPDRPGRPSGLACPDCHGVLFEIDEGPLTRFRCRVGHAWSPDSLAAEQTDELETALWMALRVLQERAALHRKIAGTARDAGRPGVAATSEDQAGEADRSASLIGQLLLGIGRDRVDDV